MNPDSAIARNSEAAASCEVLPTGTGRRVETPERLVQASCLAAASVRRTVATLRLTATELRDYDPCGGL
jgi:hypothetical protein